jgi:hypothetical protein
MNPPVEFVVGYTPHQDTASKWAAEGGRISCEDPYLRKKCYVATHLTIRYIQKTTEFI